MNFICHAKVGADDSHSLTADYNIHLIDLRSETKYNSVLIDSRKLPSNIKRSKQGHN